MDIIKEYDKELLKINKQLQINDVFIEFICNKFTNLYSENISDRTSIYIINNDKFMKVDCDFINNKFEKYNIINLKNNEWVYCDSTDIETFKSNVDTKIDIEGYFKSNLKNLYKIVNNLNYKRYTFDEYFIDGFSFIEL